MPVDRPSVPRRWPRLLAGLLLVILAASLLLGWWGLTPDRLLAIAQEQREGLVRLRDVWPILSAASFFIIYVLFTSLSLPGALFLSILAGALFSFPLALLLVSFASALGGTLAFLSARYLLRNGVQRRFGDRLPALHQELTRAGGFYLLSLRLNPLVPYVVINLLFGLTTMPAWKFWVVTQIGMIPVTSLYLLVGRQLATIHSVADIFTPEVLGVLLVISLVPLAARGLLAWRRRGEPTRPRTRWGRPVRCLLVASLACGIIWWQWPYVPDEVRTPPDAGWFSGASEVTFSHDGEWALSRHGQEAWIWRLADPQCVRKINVPSGTHVWFCRNPTWVKAAWEDGRGDFAAWHVPTGIKIKLYGTYAFGQYYPGDGQGHTEQKWAVDFNPETGEAIAWNLATAASRRFAIEGLDPTSPYLRVSLSRNGRYTALTVVDRKKPSDGRLVLLDLEAGKDLPVPITAKGGVLRAFISPTGRYVVWLTKTSQLLLWDRQAATTRQLHQFGPRDYPYSLLFTEEEQRLVTVEGKANHLLQWPLPDGPLRQLPLAFDRDPQAIHLMLVPGSRFWLSQELHEWKTVSELEGYLRRWNLGLPLEIRYWHRTAVWEEGRDMPLCVLPNRSVIGVTPDGRLLTVSDHQLQIWSLPPRRPWLLSLAWALGVGLGWWLLEAGLARWRRTAPPPAAVS